MSRRRNQDGQTTLLIVGFFVVAVLLVVVVVDASAAYLRRQELDALADGAALAATEGLAADRIYEHGLGEHAPLDPVAARRHVAAHLELLGARGAYPGLRYAVRTTADAVEVRVSTPLELPLVPPGWSSGTLVTGTASARAAVIPERAE